MSAHTARSEGREGFRLQSAAPQILPGHRAGAGWWGQAGWESGVGARSDRASPCDPGQITSPRASLSGELLWRDTTPSLQLAGLEEGWGPVVG